ncbi:hypothetical protein GWI33_006795 [Rhynchophorus ferrugineus]|uniref:Uncharacterized protein n=1 Tax=Rhynchophorus ferrugineus TaxID=354439 RepID=A0A834MF80_RHYFE|nr:hypothetical protein GWI33_006795 [Rhynchophorus ferrugineus]
MRERAPRELTFDQKQRRVDDSEQCLKMIKCNKPEFIKIMYRVTKLTPSDYSLFSDLQRMLAGKRFSSNE